MTRPFQRFPILQLASQAMPLESYSALIHTFEGAEPPGLTGLMIVLFIVLIRNKLRNEGSEVPGLRGLLDTSLQS